MKRVKLGNTGESVSAICLGTMMLGSCQDAERSYELMDHYAEAGGTFLDTANIYAFWEGGSGGESETVIGSWMRDRRNRDKIFLATKVGVGYGEIPMSLQRDIIEGECEKSLKRLGVETIDLYYAHIDDRHTPLEETLGAFDRLVRSGKVRYVGASNYAAWRMSEARHTSASKGLPEYCCIQQRHSYLRPVTGASFPPQEYANTELLDYARTFGTTILAYSALLGGTYTRDDRPYSRQYDGQDSEIRLRTIRKIADEVGATANQVVFAWMMQGDPQIIPLTAASTREQLAENLHSLTVTLSDEQMNRLTTAGDRPAG